MKQQPEKSAGDVGAAAPGDGGELEHEIETGAAADEDQADVDELEQKAREKLERERELRRNRDRKYKGKKKVERKARRAAAAGDEMDPDVAEAVRADPELGKVYEQFAGKIGTAEDLAGVYAMLFAPVGFFVHEAFELHDPATGNPTAEALQLARGTWPLMKKYGGPWLTWVREHSPEVLAISTIMFFASRKVPVVFQLVNDPSQLRINRLRAAAAAGAPSQPPRQEGAAAAAQVVSIGSDKKEAA